MRGWIKLRNEKLRTKYSPLYIARVTKLRRIRQTGLKQIRKRQVTRKKFCSKNLKVSVPKRGWDDSRK
jgi:hypothetical protein